MLRNIVGERACNCVLQEAFVGDQAIAVDGFHLRRVKIHGHDADQHQHTEDDIQNGQAGWRWQFQRQSGPMTSVLVVRFRIVKV